MLWEEGWPIWPHVVEEVDVPEYGVTRVKCYTSLPIQVDYEKQPQSGFVIPPGFPGPGRQDRVLQQTIVIFRFPDEMRFISWRHVVLTQLALRTRPATMQEVWAGDEQWPWMRARNVTTFGGLTRDVHVPWLHNSSVSAWPLKGIRGGHPDGWETSWNTFAGVKLEDKERFVLNLPGQPHLLLHESRLLGG